MQHGRFPPALPLILLGLAVAACSGGAKSSISPVAPVPSARIAVQLTDALRMEPGAITVPAGVPVTFVVTNSGAIAHEFYLGDEAAQTKHESEMQMGGMAHDDPNGVTVQAGETKELTHMFIAGEASIAGCHVAGHYAGGMKVAITVAQ